jgi:predicted DNA-binding protein (MmcQ/YjbR family)
MPKKTTKTSKKEAKKTAPSAAPTVARATGKTGEAYESSPMAEICRALPGTTFDIKWETNYCACVAGKIYCGTETTDPAMIGFKCDDIDFEKLTKRKGIIPAPYAVRFGWVKLTASDALSHAELDKYIRKSYSLVVEKLPAKTRAALIP